jgi:hypothetical protein
LKFLTYIVFYDLWDPKVIDPKEIWPKN